MLHGEVSRGMFNGLWPGFDAAEVPITSITNGVHAPTWVAREVFEAGAGDTGADPDPTAPALWERVDKVPDDDHLGATAADCAHGWSRTPALGCGRRGKCAAPRRRRAGLDRQRRSTPTC